MKRYLFFVVLLLVLPLVQADTEEQVVWTKDLENGYISTSPLIVDDTVVVRTSGFWTEEDRPHVYAFDAKSGDIIWQIQNHNSTHHDLSPLLHVKAGEGCGNSWPEMVIVGWTDGLVEALDINNGNRIWASQTEVVTWGVTGAMQLDNDLVVVPTRQGVSTFCLGNGSLEMRVDLPQLGWRNGVTVTDNAYLLGNEEGILNTVYRNGTVENQTIGEGMIRHAPLVTNAGMMIHLQTQSGSKIFIDGLLVHESGYSPAIPVIKNNIVYAATSSEFIVVECNVSSCELIDTTVFHSNGELTINEFENGEYSVWAPSNTPEGGWGVFSSTGKIRTQTTAYDTYTTAGAAFGDRVLALGSDSGVLYVEYDGEVNTEESGQSINYFSIGILGAIGLLYCWGGACAVANDWSKVGKIFLLMLLIIGIHFQPQISTKWSNWVDDKIVLEEEWEPPWNDDMKVECEGYQAVYFELPAQNYLVCGLEDFDNVEEITDYAANDESIIVEKEDHEFGS